MNGDSHNSSDEESEAFIREPQSAEERRSIRSAYRRLYEECQDNKEALVDPSSDGLRQKLLEANRTFINVSTSREGAEDAKVVALISVLGRQKIQNVQIDSVQFRTSDFVDRLFQFVYQGGFSSSISRDDSGQQRMSLQCWDALGKAMQTFFKRSPAFHCMLGSFERGALQRRERRSIRQVKDDVSDRHSSTVVKEVTEKERDTTESTSDDVALHVHPALKRAYARNGDKPVCYFTFIVNPHSFGQTVENMFHVSFLIRDGKAELMLDPTTGLPVIRPVKTKKNEQADVNVMPRHQIVTSLTMSQWKELIDKFHITHAQIPVRKPANAPGGSTDSVAHASDSRAGSGSSVPPLRRSRQSLEGSFSGQVAPTNGNGEPDAGLDSAKRKKQRP